MSKITNYKNLDELVQRILEPVDSQEQHYFKQGAKVLKLALTHLYGADINAATEADLTKLSEYLHSSEFKDSLDFKSQLRYSANEYGSILAVINTAIAKHKDISL